MSKALIVVDFQNDFVLPTGSLYVPGAETLIDPILELTYEYDFDDVIFTQDWHPEQTPHFDIWPVHCVAGTWGAQIVDELDDPYNYRFIKGTGQTNGYSGFENILLNEYLKHNQVTEVDIVGVAGDCCVKATAIDAAKAGYKTNVLLNYVKFVNFEDRYASTFAPLHEAGVTMTDSNW